MSIKFICMILSILFVQSYPLNGMEEEMSQHTATNEQSAKILLADPNYKKFIKEFGEHVIACETISLPEQRKLDTQFAVSHSDCNEQVKRTENIEVVGLDGNQIPVRIYIPNESKKLPVLIYFHGGGWVFGGIEASDAVCRRFANHLGCIVASVEYRLAPEYPFPKPLEDCYTVTAWIAKNAERFGGDYSNIIVSGESAGGNLAAAVALMARDKHGPKLSAQLLIYPVISSTIQDAVYACCAEQHFITKELMTLFWNLYLQSSGQEKNPYASVDRSLDLSALPPAVIIVAEHDPLRPEGEKYCGQLRQAGVPVVNQCLPGAIHGALFIHLYNEQQKVRWTNEIGQLLQKLGVLE